MNDNDQQPNGNPWLKSLMIWGGIFLGLLLVVSMIGDRSQPAGTQIITSGLKNIARPLTFCKK